MRHSVAVDDLDRIKEAPLLYRQPQDLLAGQPLERRLVDRVRGLQELLPRPRLDDRRHLLAEEEVLDLLVALLGQDPDLVLAVLLEASDLLLLDLLRPGVLLDPLAREDLDVDDRPLDPRRDLQGGVANV